MPPTTPARATSRYCYRALHGFAFPGRTTAPPALLLLLALGACVGPTTQLAPLPAGAVKAEQEKERDLVLQENEEQQARLDDIAYPILIMGAPLCPNDLRPRLGARFAILSNYESAMQPAAIRVFGLSDTLTVIGVTHGSPAARAGLRPGDHITAVGDDALRPGPRTLREFTELLAKHRKKGVTEFPLSLERKREARRTIIHLEEACDFGDVVIQSSELNAYADGENIYLTSTMMRFADDDELRVVIAHEFAHNAMGHLKARKQNSLFGGLLGALGDIALASRGVNTGGYYTSQGAKAGAMVFSQDFEREADYVGLYALTLADLSIAAAPAFWRHMAQADPKSIGFAHTHPTTAERFVRMEQAIAEIQQKVALKQPLQPNRIGESKLTQPPPATLAQIGAPREPAVAQAPRRKVALSQDDSAKAGGLEASSRPQAEDPMVQGYSPPADTATNLAGAAIPSLGESSVAAPGGVQSPRAEHVAADALSRDPRLQGPLHDLVRLRMVTDYQEVRRGLLRLTVGDGFSRENAAGFQLGLLYTLYYELYGDGEAPRIELWRGKTRIGEYFRYGLTLDEPSR